MALKTSEKVSNSNASKFHRLNVATLILGWLCALGVTIVGNLKSIYSNNYFNNG
jgi:hypothetical protein